MARRKGKSISFDAMIKFFMQYYNIPTRKDIDKLMAKMDRLEALIKSSREADRSGRVSGGKIAKGKDHFPSLIISPINKRTGNQLD